MVYQNRGVPQRDRPDGVCGLYQAREQPKHVDASILMFDPLKGLSTKYYSCCFWESVVIWLFGGFVVDVRVQKTQIELVKMPAFPAAKDFGSTTPGGRGW